MFNTLKQYIEQRAPLFNVLFAGIEHSGPESEQGPECSIPKKQYIEQRGPLFNVLFLGIENSGPELNKAQNVQYIKQ